MSDEQKETALLIKRDGELITSTTRELTKQDIAAITQIMLGLGAPTSTEKPKKSKKPVKKTAKFTPPALEEVQLYIAAKGFKMDAEMFYNHYQANGWKQSRGTPIKDWKAAVNNWNIREKKGTFSNSLPPKEDKPSSFDVAELEEQSMERYKKK